MESEYADCDLIQRSKRGKEDVNFIYLQIFSEESELRRQRVGMVLGQPDAVFRAWFRSLSGDASGNTKSSTEFGQYENYFENHGMRASVICLHWIGARPSP